MAKFEYNKWMIEGIKSEPISKKGYTLLRMDRGNFTGEIIGGILYQYFIKGDSINVVSRSYKSVPHPTVRSILAGQYLPDAFSLFMNMAEHEPETLERLFSEEAVNNG